MAQFQPIVLEYLEHYQPETYTALIRQQRLRAYMETLVEQLVAEAERTRQYLTEHYPERSEEQHALEADRIAIAAILSLDQGMW